MSEEKKSCKEQANEVLLRTLKTYAFACEHERLNKKDAEIMAILAGAITDPAMDFAGLMAALTAKGRREPEEPDREAIRAQAEEYEKLERERRRIWAEELRQAEERFRAQEEAKTTEEREAEEKLWRERFRDPEGYQTSC